MISAKVIADSISEHSPRLTSVQVTFPRFILAEVNTHRQFSRNYRSSRAVPIAKLIEEVRTNLYEPIVWLKNKPGMQGGEPMSGEEIKIARDCWHLGAARAAGTAEELAIRGLHKQWANRCLEPYLYVHGIITSVQWSNFFALRRHKDAQPEFKALADAIYEAIEVSKPKFLKLEEWHIPYVDGPLIDDTKRLVKISAARCARVSYKLFDGSNPNPEDDLRLYEQLESSGHMSPMEHQATPDSPGVYKDDWLNPHQHGNLKAWRQWRKFIPNECR